MTPKLQTSKQQKTNTQYLLYNLMFTFKNLHNTLDSWTKFNFKQRKTWRFYWWNFHV